MAEMTAEKAVEWLTSDKAFGQECYSRKQIAAIIEQQAAEIAKKDRMINRAINQLCKGLCPLFIAKRCLDQQNPLKGECPPDKCWRKWLEKEAEV